MPNKGAVMGVLHQLIIDSVSPDELRAQRVEVMRRIREKTGRHVLILAADPTKPAPFGPGSMLHTEDIPFFEELLSSTPRDADADVVIHSSGGLAEAAEQLSRMAKAHFREVRFVVPTLAQSAATILALSGHRLMMGPYASLGPIDPQFLQPNGTTVPAQALTEGVKKILGTSRKGRLNPGYIPMLQRVSPADLQAAQDATMLSTRLVTDSLTTGMLAGRADAEATASATAEALCSHARWLSHGRLITADQLRELGLPVEEYSDDGVAEDYNELSSLLVVTMQSNIIKLYETETVDMAKRLNLVSPPGILPDPRAANNANIDLECAKCHGKIPLQLRFADDVQLEPGRVLFPDSGKLKCPHCNADMDVKGVRQQLETQLHKKAVKWPTQEESAS